MQDALITVPAAPPAQATPSVRIDAGPTTVAQTIAIPQSVQDIAGLRSRRSELVDQLDRAGNRRDEVLQGMRDASNAERAEEAAREANQPLIDEDGVAIMATMAMVLAIPIVIAHARRIWKRPQPSRALSPATEGRVERIEQAVEAIAIEVERVSEGQRFVTRLLSEGKQVPLSLPSDR